MTSAGYTKTWKGRVVYSRKPHEFTMKDVDRILRHVRSHPGDAQLPGWVALVQRITTDMLSRILDLVGLGFLDDVVYQFLLDTVQRILTAVPRLRAQIESQQKRNEIFH